jgi:hypothetical protein
VNVKKLAAYTVIAAAGPVVIDVATDRYSDRSIVASWWHGAGILGAAVVVSWALNEAEIDISPVYGSAYKKRT